MEGWIKLHRKLQNHWVWKDPIKLKWWLDILLSVNHEPSKVNIGFELFDCGKGQSVMSLKSWGERWNVSKDTVRNFFNLLEKDGMITHENLVKTTRITVCNYDIYQGSLHDEQTQSKRKANAKQTQSDPNKNDKNDKNIYIHQRAFYETQKQICLSNGKDQGYLNFIEYVFGNNELKKPIDHILKLENQLEYEEFLDLKEKAKEKGKTVKDFLNIMVNTPKYAKGKASIYLCLNQYIANEDRYKK